MAEVINHVVYYDKTSISSWMKFPNHEFISFPYNEHSKTHIKLLNNNITTVSFGV